jgi:hypothetical protein
MAATLPAAEQQNQAGKACLRMDVDARQVNRLHFARSRRNRHQASNNLFMAQVDPVLGVHARGSR